MRLSRRRYTRLALGLWLSCLAGVALFNLIVDPYCAYQLTPDWFDDYKPVYHLAETKAELVLSRKPTALILGTSRSMVFDPLWKEFSGEETFNLGLPAASQEEVAAVLRRVVKSSPIKRVFMCLCFSQFGRTTKYGRFDRSKFSTAYSPWNYHVQNILSAQAINASCETLRDCWLNHLSSYTQRGDVRNGRFPVNGSDCKRFATMIRQDDVIYREYKPSTKAFASLRDVVRICRERKIALTVIVSPVHAMHLETAASKGLWKEYERWLHDAAIAVDQESGGKVHLWDFAGYNRYTTEPAPLTEEAPPLKYHQESSHFTRELAQKVLDRVFHSPAADPEFGVELSCENIDDRIEQLRAERAAWLDQRPPAMALLGEIFPERLADVPIDPGAILK